METGVNFEILGVNEKDNSIEVKDTSLLEDGFEPVEE